ncbi:MAG: hypothetical protein O2788_05245 [Chloroflexi bacterium]|nr:hypothetical protein [Chloroflexota bacterium]
MFSANNKREASITMCVFPHLKEFVVVDARSALPDGAALHVFSFDDVFTIEFRANLVAGFSGLIHTDTAGLMEMIGLPQEVEALVRTESMKRVIGMLNHAAGIDSQNVEGGVGVLFFARGLLSIAPEQLKVAMNDLFSKSLTEPQMKRLNNELARLISEERSAENKIRRREMAQLIQGSAGSFLTLWQNENSN